MKLMTKLLVLTVFVYGASAYAYRPAVEIPQEVVIEGYIEAVSFGTGTTPAATATIMVNSVKIYVSSETVIKRDSGYAKPGDLRVGTKVSIIGYTGKGGVIARTIYIFGK